MDQKFREGDPFSGKPMKRFGEGDDTKSLPAPPQVDEVIAAGEEVLKDVEVQEERCACGFPMDLCKKYKGVPGLIVLHMAGLPLEDL